eukprot:m.63857 g.63857  ORF g.63857 m.63857 type:complete len:378 (+) comp11463_c0_seq5:30-1163(+)
MISMMDPEEKDAKRESNKVAKKDSCGLSEKEEEEKEGGGVHAGEVMLVTGGAGFIGSHVACYLHDVHPTSTIIVLDKLSYCGDMKNLQSISSSERFVFVHGDVCDGPLVRKVFEDHRVTLVLHFAALSHVDNSFNAASAFTQTNVIGTQVVMNTCLEFQKQVKRIIHVSTDEVYGSVSEMAVEGKTVLCPTNPYSASKAAAEMIVSAYIHSFHLPVIITRGNNVYGPWQYPEKLIPKLVMRAVKGNSLPVHGDGSQLRSYIYVSDVVRAYSLLLDKGEVGKTYNIGTPKEISVNQVAEDICACIGVEAKDLIAYVKDRTCQDNQYSMSTTLLDALGWKATVSWEDGLEKTVEWYKSNMSYWKDVLAALQPHTQLPTG